MYKHTIISLALMQATALTISEEFDDFEDLGFFDVPDCADEKPARWLPAESTGVENPEVEIACNSDDEENGFRNCDCVPSRMVDWDTDPDYMADMPPGTDGKPIEDFENNKFPNGEFHLVFNSREFQALDHGTKMDMLWKQLTKVKKVKCQDWNKLWKNFEQNPIYSFKLIDKNRLTDGYSNKLQQEQEQRGYGDEMII